MNLDEYGLPVVPKGWEVKPFRRVFSESSEVNGPKPHGPMLSVSSYRGIEVKDYSHDSQRRTDEMVENYRVVRPGQLVVNTMWLNYGGLGMSSLDGHVSPAYRAYSVTHHQSLRFLNYLLRSTAYIALYTKFLTGIRPNSLQMSRDDLMKVPVLLPPLAEQECIADYLDRETATIDALIEKQRGLVAGLRRRRATAIVAATSGMQTKGDRGESSSAWLKDIPAHWSELPVKRILSDVQSGYWGSDEVGDGTDVRVVRVADFDRPTLSVGTAPTIRSVTPSERAKAALRRGDLLMEKSGGTGINPVGFVVSYESDEESIFANFIVRLRLATGQHQRFWLYALNGAYTSGLTWKSVNQTTGIQNLDMVSFLSEVFPVPPLEEQCEIADHLDRETAKIDVLIAKAERFIELAQERRAALITAAVTGQIEIPTED